MSVIDRIPTGGYSALIEAAYAVIPAGLHPLIRPHFLCGADPVFAGLHRFEDASYGRSYRDTAHVANPCHQMGLSKAQRRTTVVLPRRARWIALHTMVHELGHVLHERIGYNHIAEPVSEYAQTNAYESFAEAFTAWVLPAGCGYDTERARLAQVGQASAALLDELAA